MNHLFIATEKILEGSAVATAMILLLGAIAVALDWLVRWIERHEVTARLCKLLHLVTYVLAIIDFFVVVACAVTHAWESMTF